MDTKIQPDSLKEMSEQELLDLKRQIDDEICDIVAQIEMAEAIYEKTGERSDPVWLAKARAAKRYRGRASQLVQNEITRIKKERLSVADFAVCLMQAIKHKIEPTLAEQIIEFAKSLYRGDCEDTESQEKGPQDPCRTEAQV